MEKRITEKDIIDTIKPVIEEAVNAGDFWHGCERNVDDRSPLGFDLNVFWTDDENIYDGISITAYGLKEDTSEDSKDGVYLIDMDNTLENMYIEYKYIEKYVSQESKNYSDENIEKPYKQSQTPKEDKPSTNPFNKK